MNIIQQLAHVVYDALLLVFLLIIVGEITDSAISPLMSFALIIVISFSSAFKNLQDT